MNDKKPKVRFAPSPTGQLHLGGARTALYNWLYAKNIGGKFLLRIEDTDKVRSKSEFTAQICDSLKWMNLQWDEEIVYQSTRENIYKESVNTLFESGKAYPCFCSKDKIAEERKAAESAGGAYYYSGTCRNLDNETVKQRIANGEEYAIRIKIPDGKTSFNDHIYGRIEIANKEIDDFIIARTDGTPVYNLVVVVDDNDMGITHVIRGEDHISNTPKQIIIYKALNLPVPEFAHLPMILGPDKKRLSKRHGATGVQEYRDNGYLPEALNNYLALLGWNPGTEQEIFTIDNLVKEFSMERVQKKSAVFDEKKLQWVSGQHIHAKTARELLTDIRLIFPNWQIDNDEKYVLKVVEIMRERIRTLVDMTTMTDYFFEEPKEYDSKTVHKKWKDKSVNILIQKYVQILETIKDWNVNSIEISLRNLAVQENISPGKIIHPVRLALSGVPSGPSLFEMMELLSKDTCIYRLKRALAILPY